MSDAGDRAYVVAAYGRLVADVELRSGRLVYHEVSEERSARQLIGEMLVPPAHAKEPFASAVRTAHMLPNGVIAVTGEDQVQRRPLTSRRPCLTVCGSSTRPRGPLGPWTETRRT